MVPGEIPLLRITDATHHTTGRSEGATAAD